MGKVHLLMGAVLIGGLFTGAAQAAVLFDEDFSSYAVGSYPVPAAPVLIAPAGPTPETDVRFSFVVGETAHTRGAHIGQDPFGPAGNQSLLIGKDNANGSIGGGSNHGLVWWDDNSPNSIVGTGRFEATVFLESGTQVFSIRLGDQTALGLIATANMGPAIQRNATTGKILIRTANLTVNVDSDQDFPIGEPVHIVMDLNVTGSAATQSWSGTINGTQITTGGGANSTFAFQNNARARLDAVQFHVADSGTTFSRAYIDSFSMAIPEPGMAGLLAVGALGLLRRRPSAEI